MSDLPRLAVSPREAGKMLGLSHETVRQMVRDGRLPRVPGTGTRIVIPIAAVERLVHNADDRAAAASPVV